MTLAWAIVISTGIIAVCGMITIIGVTGIICGTKYAQQEKKEK